MEKTVFLNLKDTYRHLREILFKEKCKIIEDDASKTIVVEHGSLWGISPKTSKKNIKFNLIPESSRTRIVTETTWTSGYAVVSVFGLVLVVISTGFLFWVVSVLRAELIGAQSSLGGRFLELIGYSGYRRALVLVGIVEFFALMMLAFLAFEIILTIYFYVKRNNFAESLLNPLPS